MPSAGGRVGVRRPLRCPDPSAAAALGESTRRRSGCLPALTYGAGTLSRPGASCGEVTIGVLERLHRWERATRPTDPQFTAAMARRWAELPATAPLHTTQPRGAAPPPSWTLPTVLVVPQKAPSGPSVPALACMRPPAELAHLDRDA